MASSTRPRFANYPVPTESTNIKYEFGEDKNPTMRGLPLAIAGALVSRSSFLAKVLFNNAGFATIRDIPELQHFKWRFHPTVIPMPEEGADTCHIPIDEDLHVQRQDDLPGRYYSAADYHQFYKSGALSPVDVVQAISAFSVRGGVETNKDYQTAWTYSNIDLALAKAKESESRYRDGKPLGILDGVPIAVKDDCAVEGYRTCKGMTPEDGVAFFDPVKETVWPVKKLEEAGAIIVGKCAMHQLGTDTTGCNPGWGTPINWHNPAYYPGGSSSGPASAVCAGLIPITVATDAGGSIRIPPSFTGTYGLKVSHDRTYCMNSTLAVMGPLCSTATDLTIAYRIMSQPNPSDPIQGSFAISQPPSQGAKKYIGICRPWFDRADKPVLDHCMRAVDYFTNSQGYEMIDIDIPYLREGQLAHAIVALTEMADLCRHYGKTVEESLRLVNSANKILMSVGQQASSGDYLKCNQIRHILMQHMAHLFKTYPGMIVVTPTTPMVGWKRDKADDAHGVSDANRSIRNMTYVWLANSTGCPAVSVPVGYAAAETESGHAQGDGQGGGEGEGEGEGKLPVGLMGMAEWGAEEDLLAWAREAEVYLDETKLDGRVRPKGWVDVLDLAKGEKIKRTGTRTGTGTGEEEEGKKKGIR